MKYSPLLFISSLLLFSGCTNRTITDYEDCVSNGLTFELKDNMKAFIIDDSEGERKYSSMNFPDGEYYLCIKEGLGCAVSYGGYTDDWSRIYEKSKIIRLTGKYKTNEPNAVLGAFAPDTFALQVEIGDRKAWVSVSDFKDMSIFKESSTKSVQELNKNRKLATDWNDWMTDFYCPNPNVQKVSSERIWFD